MVFALLATSRETRAIGAVLVWALSAVSCRPSTSPTPVTRNQPNLLLITLDTTRAE
ncbi:MAG: hypothetical protein ACYSUQ_10125 [Planctomycetota bacterium]